MILEEFDREKSAVINPWNIIQPIENMPKVAVTCYAHTTFERMIQELNAEYLTQTSCANGISPIYKAQYKGTEIALFMIGVGAPMSVGMLEEIYQMGTERVVVFGTCGVLDQSIEDCSVIIPYSAVRDEGTSYHYAPSSEEIPVNTEHLEAMRTLLDTWKIKYTVGKTWSNDAFYRETREKVRRRKAQGCVCVDMECSANAAIAAFRGKELVQFFYAADNLDKEDWDVRSLSNDSRIEDKDRIAALALEFAVSL